MRHRVHSRCDTLGCGVKVVVVANGRGNDVGGAVDAVVRGGDGGMWAVMARIGWWWLGGVTGGDWRYWVVVRSGCEGQICGSWWLYHGTMELW